MNPSLELVRPQKALLAYEWLIIAAIAALTLEPLWSVGLTNTDDMVYSQLGYTHDWDSPLTNAIGMGRFYYMYSGFLYMLPYLIKNAWYFKLFSVGPLIAIPLLLGKVLHKLTQQSNSVALTLVVYFVGLQMYTDYYPTAAFPFVFTFSISLFLIAYWAWLHYRETGARLFQGLSLALFVLSILPYETFVFLFTAIFAMNSFFAQRQTGKSLLAATKTTISELKWHGVVLSLYVIAFVSFACLPTPPGFSRDHYQLSSGGFNAKGFASTLWHFSSSALPTASLFYGNTKYLAHAYWDSPQLYSTTYDIFRIATVDWWLRAFLVGGVVVALLYRSPRIQLRTFASLGAVGVFVFAASPLLHALTAKYQKNVAQGVYVYLPTFFSYLGFVVFVVSLLLYLNGIVRNSKLSKVWLGCIAIVFSFVSIAHSFNNFHVARYQAHLSFTWTLMDQCAKSQPFQQLPEGAIVYAPTMPRATVTYDMLTNTVGDYWEDYIHVVSGKRLHMVYSLADLASHSNETVYYFGLNKMPKDFQAYAVLGRLSDMQSPAGNIADEFDLMTYSKYKEFELSFQHKAAEGAKIEIEGQSPLFAKTESFKAAIVRGVPTALVITHVAGQAINLDTVDLSFFKLPK